MNSILGVRLGAMGDILHALPAMASLKKSFPEKRIIWVVARKWIELLDGNPNIDELVPFDRQNIGALGKTWRRLRAIRPEIAIDFQGLIQSALVGRSARPKLYIGLASSLAREPLAALFYTRRITADGPHRVERNLQLAAAAGAALLTEESWLPPGRPEGELPAEPLYWRVPSQAGGASSGRSPVMKNWGSVCARRDWNSWQTCPWDANGRSELLRMFACTLLPLAV